MQGLGGMMRSLMFSTFVRGKKGKFGSNQSRGMLTPKRSPVQYYKGKGCRSLGFLSRKGRFVLEERKLPYYEVPDLTGFKLKPYVTNERLLYEPYNHVPGKTQ